MIEVLERGNGDCWTAWNSIPREEQLRVQRQAFKVLARPVTEETEIVSTRHRSDGQGARFGDRVVCRLDEAGSPLPASRHQWIVPSCGLEKEFDLPRSLSPSGPVVISSKVTPSLNAVQLREPLLVTTRTASDRGERQRFQAGDFLLCTDPDGEPRSNVRFYVLRNYEFFNDDWLMEAANLRKED